MGKSDTSDVMVKIRGDHKDLDDAVRKSRSTLENFGQMSTGIATKLAGIGIAATATGVAMGAMAVHQAFAFDGLEKSFKRLVDQQGEDADRFMATLKEMSANTLTEMEIMERANMGLMLGLDTETLETFMKTASTIAQATGADVLDMFDSLTSGTARQSRELLDNLGIMVSVESANEAYAESLGKTVSELTNEESRIAFTNAALAASEDKLKSLGGYVVDTKSKWEQFGVIMKESSVSLGQKLMPELDKVLDWALSNKTWLADTFTEIFGIDTLEFGTGIVENLEKMKTWVDDNKTGLISLWEEFGVAGEGVVTMLGDVLTALEGIREFAAANVNVVTREEREEAKSDYEKLSLGQRLLATPGQISKEVLGANRAAGESIIGSITLMLDGNATKSFMSGQLTNVTIAET